MRNALVVAGAAAVLVAATAGFAASQATTSDSSDKYVSSRTFTVVERAITDTTTDTGAKGDTVGDVLTFANPLYGSRNLNQRGSDNGSCIRTAKGKAYECSWTNTLRDGALVVEGPFYDTGDSVLAITGGTGVYAHAHGQMRLHPRNAAGSAYDFTFSVK